MKKNQLFQWLSLQQQAFEKIKQVLAIAKVISYSDPKKETENVRSKSDPIDSTLKLPLK